MVPNKIVYLDNNATTKVDSRVLEAMLPYFSEHYGNPSSIYHMAHDAHIALDKARETVKDFFGAKSKNEVVFTASGSESINMAIRGALALNKDKKHIITTAVEHAAVINLYKALENEGYSATYLKVDNNGDLDLEELKNAIKEDTALVSVMWANNETGIIFPVEEIAKIVKEKNPNTKVFVDGVQAAGKIKMDLANTEIDFVSISGHKFHAPKGVGALYIKSSNKIPALIIGGHQERALRAGTENVPYIVGLGEACKLVMENFDENQKKIERLRDKLEKGILENVFNARLNSKSKNRVSNTTNIGFEYIEGEMILLHFDEVGICASSGSACTSDSLEPSHVLRAMNVPFTSLHGSIRFSLSHFTTEEEIDYAIQVIPPIIEKIASISPFQKELKALKEKN